MKMNKIEITILVENTTENNALKTEHGLAYWIQVSESRILFDAGQSNILISNARQLGIDIAHTEAIVLSHGHYDHTGGLADVISLAKIPSIRVYAHSQAFDNKYGCKLGIAKYIGISKRNRQSIFSDKVKLTDTSTVTEILPGVFVTGQIPRNTSFEDVGGPFYTDKQCQTPDLLLDDEALYFGTSAGTVVLLGCAHAGVVNTLMYIKSLTNNNPIYAVIGGMHLINANENRITQTAKALHEFDVKLISPAHCTGERAKQLLRNELANKYTDCQTGSKFTFDIT